MSVLFLQMQTPSCEEKENMAASGRKRSIVADTDFQNQSEELQLIRMKKGRCNWTVVFPSGRKRDPNCNVNIIWCKRQLGESNGTAIFMFTALGRSVQAIISIYQHIYAGVEGWTNTNLDGATVSIKDHDFIY